MKLYRSAVHPGSWLAHVPGKGWICFPARENGWAERRPARGLDPVHLREVPLDRAAGTGILDRQEEEDEEFAGVA